MRNSSLLAAATLVTAALPSLALASSVPWSIRLAATEVNTAKQSDAFGAQGLEFPSRAVDVGNRTIPEAGIDYAFTPNFVGRLVLSYPQTADVPLRGPARGASLGTFKLLGPSLVGQDHFLAGQTIGP